MGVWTAARTEAESRRGVVSPAQVSGEGEFTLVKWQTIRAEFPGKDIAFRISFFKRSFWGLPWASTSAIFKKPCRKLPSWAIKAEKRQLTQDNGTNFATMINWRVKNQSPRYNDVAINCKEDCRTRNVQILKVCSKRTYLFIPELLRLLIAPTKQRQHTHICQPAC